MKLSVLAAILAAGIYACSHLSLVMDSGPPEPPKPGWSYEPPDKLRFSFDLPALELTPEGWPSPNPPLGECGSKPSWGDLWPFDWELLRRCWA